MARPKLVSKPDALQASSEAKSGTVVSVNGSVCEFLLAGKTQSAAVATHVLCLQPGQRVMAVQSSDDDWLIVAAWPMAGSESPFQFDTQTKVLRIQASRLQLSAVAAIELQCGDACMRLTLDGKVHIEGADVLSSAVGSNRIEGASIDLN
jgi:hypothetical protein